MSITKYFNNKLPEELVSLIYEYADPATTALDDKINKIVNNFSYDTRFSANKTNIRYLWYQEIKEPMNYEKLWCIMQYIKSYYRPAKSITQYNERGGDEEKHFIEARLRYNNKKIMQYIKRGEAVLAFMLLGYKYTVKNDTIYIYQKENIKALNKLNQNGYEVTY